MSDTVQQIKDRLSIVDVVSGYVKLDRAGSSLRARCPFHNERTPSFHVSPERGTYHCFGCGVGGDIFSFVEAIEGLDFKGALKVLAEKANVPLVYSRGGKEKEDDRDRLFALVETATLFYQSHLTVDSKKYLHDRGMNDATIVEFRVGWAGKDWSLAVEHLKSKGFTDKEILDAGLGKRNERGQLSDKFRNRIMFPIADGAGRVVGFSGRIFGEDASPEAPKYLNSPETPLFHKSRILYGFDRAKMSMRKLSCAVLVEGQMDLLASHQAGWSNAVAVSGTAFTVEHAALIKRMTENIILALDPDEAGVKAAGRAARAALAGGMNVKVAQLPDGLDPADLIKEKGPDAFKDAIKNAKDIITFLLDVLQAHAKSPDRFRRNVEAVVLPFLTDVQSPIAREQYMHEISKRLGVSETAVADTVAKLPSVPKEVAEATKERASIETAQREKSAYAILLWQAALPKTTLDTKALTEKLREAVGDAAFSALEKLPDSEKERMRFSAERLYGPDHSPKQDFDQLLKLLTRERLSAELAETTLRLRDAENRGDAALSEELLERSKLLTGQIANLLKIE